MSFLVFPISSRNGNGTSKVMQYLLTMQAIGGQGAGGGLKRRRVCSGVVGRGTWCTPSSREINDNKGTQLPKRRAHTIISVACTGMFFGELSGSNCQRGSEGVVVG